MKLKFSTNFRKILKYQISWKPSFSRRVVSCGRTDGQKDRETRRN